MFQPFLLGQWHEIPNCPPAAFSMGEQQVGSVLKQRLSVRTGLSFALPGVLFHPCTPPVAGY